MPQCNWIQLFFEKEEIEFVTDWADKVERLRSGCPTSNPMGVRTGLIGKLGELAFSFIFPYKPDFNIYENRGDGGVDFITNTGRSVDVKSCKTEGGKLLVPVGKVNADVYVYAYINLDAKKPYCNLGGWAFQKDVCAKTTLVDYARSDGPLNHIIPQQKLRSIYTLRQHIVAPETNRQSIVIAHDAEFFGEKIH